MSKKKYLTPNEMRDELNKLGYDLKVSSIWQYIRQGKLKAEEKRISPITNKNYGKQYFIPKKEAKRFLKKAKDNLK